MEQSERRAWVPDDHKTAMSPLDVNCYFGSLIIIAEPDSDCYRICTFIVITLKKEIRKCSNSRFMSMFGPEMSIDSVHEFMLGVWEHCWPRNH